MRHVASLALLLIAFATLPAAARERCDLPGEPGFHIKVTLGSGGTSYDSQQDYDMIALRKAGVIARSVQRTSDGCIEAWVPNGDGSFHNEYYNPADLGLGGTLNLNIE